MKHFINKHIIEKEQKVSSNVYKVAIDKGVREINKKKNKAMVTENLSEIEKIAEELTADKKAKKIKTDKGLIERVESQKILITEDNRQLLND